MNGLPEGPYDVYLGLDVGKSAHHATALTAAGKRVHDKPLPQDEAKLRSLYGKLAKRGRVLVVVDQPATIGALPVAVARQVGLDVAYLPGLAMRRIADLHPGNAKTDARDAYVIADAARTMPHALRRVDIGDDALADLEVIVGFDDDLASEVTRITNRIHGLLTHIHPALERALGPRLNHPAVLTLLATYGGPTGLARVSAAELTALLAPLAPRLHPRLISTVQQALAEQSVVVPGTRAAELVLPHLAAQLQDLLTQRDQAAAQVEEMLDAHPLAPVLTSMHTLLPRS